MSAQDQILDPKTHTADELAKSLAMMCATLESTTDAILVTDESNRVTSFNERYVTLWRISPEIMASADAVKVRQFISPQMKDPAGYLARAEEINASGAADSFDILELADGRVFERNSANQLIKDRSIGRVWS